MADRMLAILLALTAASVCGAEQRAFSGLSTAGPTGMILIPTAQVLNLNWYAVGLHRGIIKGAYGLGLAEAGVALPDLFDKPNADGWKRGLRGFAKLGTGILGGHLWIPRLGAGLENTLDKSGETYYGVVSIGGGISDWLVEASGGIGNGRFREKPFAGIGIIPGRLLGYGMKFIVEYSADEAIIGARFALSKDMRLDLGMLLDAFKREGKSDSEDWSLRIQRAWLGASRAQEMNWARLFPKPKPKPEAARNP